MRLEMRAQSGSRVLGFRGYLGQLLFHFSALGQVSWPQVSCALPVGLPRCCCLPGACFNLHAGFFFVPQYLALRTLSAQSEILARLACIFTGARAFKRVSEILGLSLMRSKCSHSRRFSSSGLQHVFYKIDHNR